MIFGRRPNTTGLAQRVRIAWVRSYGTLPVRAVFATLDAEAFLDPRWNLIKDQAESAIVRYSKVIKTERDERPDFNPRMVVYGVGEIACAACLGSDRYYLFPGALTHKGTMIESLARHILRMLHEFGAYSNEDYQASRDGLRDLVARSG